MYKTIFFIAVMLTLPSCNYKEKSNVDNEYSDIITEEDKMKLIHIIKMDSIMQLEKNKDRYDCEACIKKAKYDFEQGNLTYTVYGLIKSPLTEYVKIFKKDFGVTVKIAGCEVNNQCDLCYNNFMEEAIKQKFGEDIFERVYERSKNK